MMKYLNVYVDEEISGSQRKLLTFVLEETMSYLKLCKLFKVTSERHEIILPYAYMDSRRVYQNFEEAKENAYEDLLKLMDLVRYEYKDIKRDYSSFGVVIKGVFDIGEGEFKESSKCVSINENFIKELYKSKDLNLFS